MATDLEIANPHLTKQTDWIDLPTPRSVNKAVTSIEQFQSELKKLRQKALTASVEDIGHIENTFKLLSRLSKTAPKQKVALESFSNEQKNIKLSNAIGEFSNQLDDTIRAALEDYSVDFRDDYDTLKTKYNKAFDKLETVDADIEFSDPRKMAVNHNKLWTMFHVRNTFNGQRPLETIKAEANRHERLVKLVTTATKRIQADVEKLKPDEKLDRASRDIPILNRTWFMFNRDVKIDDGQPDFNEKKPAAPKKSYSGMQWFIYLLVVFLFGVHGDNFFHIFAKKSKSEAKTETKLSTIHQYIRAVLGLKEIVDELEESVDTLQKLYKRVTPEQLLNLNRRVSPLMDLIHWQLKQVTELTHGTDTMFSKLVRQK